MVGPHEAVPRATGPYALGTTGHLAKGHPGSPCLPYWAGDEI